MRRYAPRVGVELCLTAVAAFLAGGALLGPLGQRWFGAEAIPREAAPPPSSESDAARGSDCASNASLVSASTPPPRPPFAAAECAGRLSLFAGGAPKSGEVRPGAPPAEVIALHAERLLVRLASGDRCDLPLRGRWVVSMPASSDAPTESVTDAPLATASGGLSSADFATAFRRSDERHYTVDAAVLRTVLENGGDAVEIALTPEPSDGGARLGPYTGLFGYLGLVQGDVLVAANEAPITEVDDLVQSFGAIGPRRPLALRIRRGGRELTVQYASD